MINAHGILHNRKNEVEMTEIIPAVLGITRVVLGFLILLVLPGFGVTLAYFPEKSGIPAIDRLILSGVLSIGLVILCGLFADFVLGVYTTPENILILLFCVTALSLCIWRIRRWYAGRIRQDDITGIIAPDSRGLARNFLRFLGRCRMKIASIFDERTL